MFRRERTPEEHEAGVLRKWARHDERMSWLERYGVEYMYAPGYEERETRAIRSAISRKLSIPLPAPEVGPITQDEGAWCEILNQSLCAKCGSADVMEFEAKHGFGCEACNKLTLVVLGCLNCTHIRCPECVVVRHMPNLLLPLHIIAADLELSIEGARQVIETALRKLRHPSRSNLLKHFVDWIPRYEAAGIAAFPKAPGRSRTSWTELALAEADSTEEATGACANCGHNPEALRACTLCGAKICSSCCGPYHFGAPRCGRASWHVNSHHCRQRQAGKES
jgi:hypothetical protein